MDLNGFLSQREQLVGQEISVLSVLSPGAGLCTEAECGPDDPCCNSCGSAIGFPTVPDVSLEGSDPNRFSCSGDSCTQCCGIDLNDNGEYIVTGTLTRPMDGQFAVTGAEVCRR